MAAHQNSTYYCASSNLTTHPESSVVCVSFQPAAATSEEPQPVSSAQIFGQSWTQPRSQGFSLMNWVAFPNSKGKSPGNEVVLDKRVRGGTASFAKRKLFRAPQRMFCQVYLFLVQRMARMSYLLLAILHGACILNNKYVGKE